VRINKHGAGYRLSRYNLFALKSCHHIQQKSKFLCGLPKKWCQLRLPNASPSSNQDKANNVLTQSGTPKCARFSSFFHVYWPFRPVQLSKDWAVIFLGAPVPYRDGFNMKKVVIVAALLAVTGCSTVSTATGAVGGAAKSTVQTIGGWFGG